MALDPSTLAAMYASGNPQMQQLAVQGGYVPPAPNFTPAQGYTPAGPAGPNASMPPAPQPQAAAGAPQASPAPFVDPNASWMGVAQQARMAASSPIPVPGFHPIGTSGLPTASPAPQAQDAAGQAEMQGAAVDPSQVVNAPSPLPQSPAQSALGAPVTLPAHAISLVSPQVRAGIEQGLGEQKAAQQEQGAAEQGFNSTQASLADQEAAQAANNWVDIRAKQRERQQVLNQHMARIDELTDRAASEHEDPDAIFRGPAGSGNRAMATIAVALGELGKGLTHQRGESAASRIVDDAITRSIAAQREGIAQDWRKADQAKWSLAERLKEFQDPQVAEQAERDAQLHQYAAMAKAQALRSGSPLLQAKADKLAADLDLSATQARAGLEHWAQAATINPANYGLSDVKPEEVMQLGDGRYVTVPEKDREDVQKAVKGAENARAAGNAIQSLLKTPITDRGIGWARDFDAAVDNLSLGEVYAGGKGGKGVIELFKSAAGKRLATLTPGDHEAVQRIVQGAQQRAESAIGSSAQYEVSPQLQQMPTGEVRRKYRILGNFARKPVGAIPDYQVTPAGQEPRS